VRFTVRVPLLALLTMLNVPVTVALTTGLKVTLSAQEPPGGTGVVSEHVPRAKLNVVLPPVVTEEMFSGPVPVLFTVSVVVVVVPFGRAPKFTVFTVVMVAGVSAVPDNVATAEPAVGLDTVSVAVLSPAPEATVGVNRTPIRQAALAARFLIHVVTVVNWLAFVPPNTTELTAIVAAVVFRTVITWMADTVPTFWPAKVSDAGVSATPGTVTVFDCAENGPVPTALTAATLNASVVPAARPVRVNVLEP